MANLFYGTKIADFAASEDTLYYPGDVTEVTDPIGGKQTVLKMTVDDSHNLGVTANPRAQLSTTNIITNGLEFWMATEIMFPIGHPTITSWFTVNTPMWGSPFGGTGAPVHAEASYDRFINWARSGTYSFDGPITAPSPWPRGVWKQILWHVKFATAGWVELWLNNSQVTFFKPGESYNPGSRPQTTKLEMQTREAGTNDGGNNHCTISYYREKGQYTVGTAYYKGLTIATTKEDLKLAEFTGESGGGGSSNKGLALLL